jgi:ribonuclease-3
VPESRPYQRLEERLGYTFRNRELLESALTHKSYLNENQGLCRPCSERLEFLGDSVVGLAVSHLLMERFPAMTEGELSKTRAQTVNEAALFELATSLDLGPWLFLGKGEEQTGGRHKISILADACEATVGAVYLDGGFKAAFDLVGRLFCPQFEGIEEPGFTDFKTRLQERAQALRHETPRYAVTAEYGPEHDKLFEVAVSIGEREYARAGGRSKKVAEQRAAASALFLVEGEDPIPT